MMWAYSLGLAAVVTLPWVIAGRQVGAVVAFCLTFLLGWVWVYLDTPSLAGPLFGELGLIAMLLLFASGTLSLFTAPQTPRQVTPFFVAVGTAMLFILIAIGNSTLFRASEYAALAPTVDQREWSADFQPKDPRHFRVSSAENAVFLAGRAKGQATTLDTQGRPNAIGSQFSVDDEVSSPQIIKGELWTIVPLDWSGIGPQFSSTVGIPGYIKVSGENPITPAEFVRLPPGKEFRYTPEAMWGNNLDRLVWRYHPYQVIADKHLEIDDEGQPHYIISMAEPTIGWWGEKVIGALIVDPVTGAGVENIIPVGQEPAWVDRVEAEWIVHRNIDFHGKYAQGYWNKSIFGNNVLAATETHFGYGSDGQPVFATGITSHNTSSGNTQPDSLAAVYYTNTRTGKTTEYMMQGGTTEARAIEQCNLLGDVKNKGYHATTPQLYNVYGHISYVAPLQNQSHAYKGVCIVSVMNLQVIAWGPSAYDAETAFKQMIVSNGSQVAIDGTRKISKITGRVDRVGAEIVSGASVSLVHLMHVEGFDHLFLVPYSASAKVPVTQVGDTVVIEYFDSGEATMPIDKFDNTSLTLATSANEAEVTKRAGERVEAAHVAQEVRRDAQAILNTLTPEQQAVLRSQLKQ